MREIIDLFLHVDEHLTAFVAEHGKLVYGMLFGIIFAETGLVVAPFLPGDSLLFAAGAIAATGGLNLYVTTLLLFRRLSIDGGTDLDFSPATANSPAEPPVDVDPEDGPVMVTIEYVIDPARAAEFADVMQRTRRARLRQGALSWGLFRDVAHPERVIEYFVDENWVEHQRRLERFSAFDAELRIRRLALHIDSQPPRVRRYVAKSLDMPPHPPG